MCKQGLLFFSLLLFCLSCNKQNKDYLANENFADPFEIAEDSSEEAYVDPFKGLNIDAQLMMVLRQVFQDSQENYWFVGDEVYCYNGDSLISFDNMGLFEKVVTRVVEEDQTGNLWIGSSQGVYKFDPTINSLPGPASFSKYSAADGMLGNDVWSLKVDRMGRLWIGTMEGLSYFDGQEFTHFPLPEAEVDPNRGVSSPNIVHSITEDSKGKLWFGTNGGAYVYDGKELQNISTKDGLCHNAVNDIEEDKAGNIWFATHYKGICRWDGESFTTITEELGLEEVESCFLFKDKAGNIWFPIEHHGVYRYDGTSLKNFHIAEGFPMNGVFSMIQDHEDNYWFSGFGGLYRYDGNSFLNFNKDTSWDF